MKTNKLAYLLTLQKKSKDNIDYIVLVDDLKELNTEQFSQFTKIVGIDLFNMPILLSNDINFKSMSSLAYRISYIDVYDRDYNDYAEEYLVIVDRFEDILQLEELQKLNIVNIENLEYPVIFN